MQESRYIKQTLNDLTVRVDTLSKAIENIKRKKKGKLSRAGSFESLPLSRLAVKKGGK